MTLETTMVPAAAVSDAATFPLLYVMNNGNAISANLGSNAESPRTTPESFGLPAILPRYSASTRRNVSRTLDCPSAHCQKYV
jgi:hypothetical protein